MRFEKVGIIANECGRAVVASVGEELRCAYERCDVDRQCRWRETLRFFPTVLRSNRTFADEEPTGATNHPKGIEVSQGIVFPESPGQQNREGHFIQLNARPVRSTIDPEILKEPAILALRYRKIDKRA